MTAASKHSGSAPLLSSSPSASATATATTTAAAATTTRMMPGASKTAPRVHRVPPLSPSLSTAPAAVLQTTTSNNSNNSNSNNAAATWTHMSRREAALQTTGQTRLVVTDSEKNSVRFHLCVQALSQGCIAAYMHLFELAHRPPVCVDALAQTYYRVPDDRLCWVQEQLCAVEVLRRQSNFREVCARCAEVAAYFEGVKDSGEAARHHDAALGYAIESLDRALEQEVRAAYAAFRERGGQHARAARLYTSMYRLACALDDEGTARAACVHLVRVYDALATRVGAVDVDAARTFREVAARYAQRSRDPLVEARAYGELGDAHEHAGNLAAALRYQRGCRDTAARAGARGDACRATLHVAQLEERLSLRDEAAASLREALTLATELADEARVCRATMQMGEAHRSDGDSAAAMACFEQSFRAACASGQRELIDSARVAMGFAMGDYYMTHAQDNKGYMHVVCNDVRAQLAWQSTGTL